MQPGTKRGVLFFVGCIGLRTALAYAVWRIDGQWTRTIGIPVASAFILGWCYILFVSPRDTGMETFGGDIWWQALRPIHVALYCVFIYLSLRSPTVAYVPLVLDVVVALLATLFYHVLLPVYKNNDQ
jgi:hypothetical protein